MRSVSPRRGIRRLTGPWDDQGVSLTVRVCATPCPPALGVADVRLVDLALDADAVTRAESSLTAAEVARARRGAPAVHRRRVLLRASLRMALAVELDIPPVEVPIGTTALGRPYVTATVGGAPLDVSCSASSDLGIVAVTRGRRIGIDVEHVAPWAPEVLDEAWLSDSERRALARLPPADRAEAVTRCWTQKEAVLKARGTGLYDDPATVVTIAGTTDGDAEDGRWRIWDVPVPHGWVASLAAASKKEKSS
jgi:4'-phosphopantetheinyl transferase